MNKCDASYLSRKMRRLLPRLRLPPSKAPMIHSRSSSECVKLLFAEPVDGGRGKKAQKRAWKCKPTTREPRDLSRGWLSRPVPPLLLLLRLKIKYFFKLENGAASFRKALSVWFGGERRKILSSYVQCSSCSGGEPAHTNVPMLLLQGAAASASPGPKAAPH